jgi:hypothetical protein
MFLRDLPGHWLPGVLLALGGGRLDPQMEPALQLTLT